MLLNSKSLSVSDAGSLRWKKFKRLSSNQGVDKLPPTSGAFRQHTMRAHLQAAIWAQDMVINPVTPDPCTLGWNMEGDLLVPVLSATQAAPEAVAELFQCNCGVSECAGRYTCRSHQLPCTELCRCEGNADCSKTNYSIDHDDE